MKILIAAHFFPPDRTAGAEKRALGYALELRKRGHQVQVVCAGDWDAGAQYWNGYNDDTYQGVAVRRVNLNWAAASDPNRVLYDSPLLEAQFERWLDEWRPDVLHIISLITLTGGVVRAAKKRGLPIVFTLTDFWMICPKISLVRGDGSLCDGQVTSAECLKCLLFNATAYRALRRVLPEAPAAAALRWASRRPAINRVRGLRGMALNMDERRRYMAELAPAVDCVTAPSSFLGKVIDNSGIFPRPVRIIHSGHDLSWLQTMPEKQPSQVIRLGYIGQLIPVKGPRMLIEAFQSALNGGRNCQASLLIYGDEQSDPAYAAALRAMVRPGDAVQFLGAFPHNRLGEVLAGLDVLVTPSQWHENNPRVIQEAFASRTPVIASNVGGISEFIQHDVNGLLFQYDDPEALREQITRVICEPGLVARLQNGIRPVKTIAEEIGEFEQIYESLAPAA